MCYVICAARVFATAVLKIEAYIEDKKEAENRVSVICFFGVSYLNRTPDFFGILLKPDSKSEGRRNRLLFE